MRTPNSYADTARHALISVTRKQGRSRMAKTSNTASLFQRRQALRVEACAFYEAIDAGQSVWQFAVSLGWEIPLVCFGNIEDAACDWIDARWGGNS